MLVTFSCDAHENITLFGDIAKRLLLMMGHSGTVPGAIKAQDVPNALASLTRSLKETDTQKVNRLDDSKEQDDDEEEISLAKRAYPLIQLLKNATAAQCDVMWS